MKVELLKKLRKKANKMYFVTYRFCETGDYFVIRRHGESGFNPCVNICNTRVEAVELCEEYRRQYILDMAYEHYGIVSRRDLDNKIIY